MIIHRDRLTIEKYTVISLLSIRRRFSLQFSISAWYFKNKERWQKRKTRYK